MSAPEFLAIGHVTLDRFGDVVRPGGTALYAAVTAARLGLRAAILTSHGPDFPLDAIPRPIEVVTLEAPLTTVFEHRWEAGRRVLRVRAQARALTADDVPADWREARLVLLGPVIDEVDPGVVEVFEDATLAASAQGWLRAVGPGGEVHGRPWTPPPGLLGRLQALFVSAEDVRGQEDALAAWLECLPLGVVTAGATGALLYVNAQRYEVAPRPARVVDPTGAGDVFAAAFLVEYERLGDPWAAAAAATCAASLAVEGEGWQTVPDRAALAAALAAYLGGAA